MPRGFRHALVVGLVVLGPLAYAGPPYQTDDPEPVATGGYEINIATQQTLTSSGRVGTAPGTEINYGAAPGLQLHAGLPLAFVRSGSGTGRCGLGDLELGAKYRVVQETDIRPMVAIYPTFVVPTGDAARGLGNGRGQLLLPVWSQKSIGPWTVDAGLGYLVNRAPDSRNNWFFGSLVQRRITDRLVLGAEIFHRTRASRDGPASTGFNVGATFDLTEHVHVLVSAGEGLRHRQQTNIVTSYAAFQITY